MALMRSICDIKDEELVVIGTLEVLERATHLDPGMSCSHPEKLGRKFFNLMTENNRHSNFDIRILRLHQDRNYSIVLITCEFCWLFIFYKSKMEVCLSCLFLSFLVLIIFDFFVEFLGVNLRDVLDHHCNIFGIEWTLRLRKKWLNI